MTIPMEFIAIVREQMNVRAADTCTRCQHSFVDDHGYLRCGVNPSIRFGVSDNSVCDLFSKGDSA